MGALGRKLWVRLSLITVALLHALTKSRFQDEPPLGLPGRLWMWVLVSLERVLTLSYKTPEVRCMLRDLREVSLLRAARKASWWRPRIPAHQTLSTLKHLRPIQRKDLLGVERAALFTQHTPEANMVWKRTSGTTGVPFVWGVDSRTYYSSVAALYARLLKERGVSFFSLAVRRSFVTFNFKPCYQALYPFTRALWAHNDAETVRAAHALARISKKGTPTVLFTYPTELLSLTRAAKRHAIYSSLSLIITTGQDLDEEVRLLASQYFNCPVVSMYATQEIGATAFECREQAGRFHPNEEHVVIEILDETGREVPPEQVGRITLTALSYTRMPLIRYQPGDMGALYARKCSCSHASLALGCAGRDFEMIYLSNGSEVPIRRIRSLLLEDGCLEIVRQFQIVQESMEKLRVLVSLTPPATVADLPRRLLEGARMATADQIEIAIEVVDAIPMPGGKARGFIPLKRPTDR